MGAAVSTAWATLVQSAPHRGYCGRLARRARAHTHRPTARLSIADSGAPRRSHMLPGPDAADAARLWGYAHSLAAERPCSWPRRRYRLVWRVSFGRLGMTMPGGGPDGHHDDDEARTRPAGAGSATPAAGQDPRGVEAAAHVAWRADPVGWPARLPSRPTQMPRRRPTAGSAAAAGACRRKPRAPSRPLGERGRAGAGGYRGHRGGGPTMLTTAAEVHVQGRLTGHPA